MDIKNIFGKVQELRNLRADDDDDLLESAVSDDDYEDSRFFAGELENRVSVGEFRDEYGNDYAMVLNRDYVRTRDISLQLKAEKRVYEVSTQDGRQYVLNENVRDIGNSNYGDPSVVVIATYLFYLLGQLVNTGWLGIIFQQLFLPVMILSQLELYVPSMTQVSTSQTK